MGARPRWRDAPGTRSTLWTTPRSPLACHLLVTLMGGRKCTRSCRGQIVICVIVKGQEKRGLKVDASKARLRREKTRVDSQRCLQQRYLNVSRKGTGEIMSSRGSGFRIPMQEGA